MWPFRRKAKARRNGSLPATPAAGSAMALLARYDAAVTTVENVRHWANADGLSADAAASAEVRRILRNRSRYEVANNSYAKGIVLTLANDVIGTGPRLQLLTEDPDANHQVEQAFMAWATEIRLPEKLRTMRMAKAADGEAFAILINNHRLAAPGTLDIRIVEADRVATPVSKLGGQGIIDGIQFDRFDKPARYFILRGHPGGDGLFETLTDEYLPYDANAVIHWFRSDRPEQHRGVPEITPALPLFAQLRRYTLAVLAAAETAADFAAVLYTDAPANGEAAAVEPMDVVALEKRMATTLPDGWKLGQIKAEQPGTTYGEFKRELLNEIARCLNMPFNVAAGNSSGYNYASGRLDHQTYFKSIRVEQCGCNAVVLDRIFTAWLAELVSSGEFSFLRGQPVPAHQWFWDGMEHVDPAKEASAQATRLSSHTTTLANEYARQGKDWETELRQRAKERMLMNELGLTSQAAAPQPEEPDDSEDTEVDPSDEQDRQQAA